MNKILAVLFILLGMKASSQNDGALAIGDSLYALGNYQKAIKSYQKNKNLNFKIAKTYETIGDYDQALSYYHKTLLLNPNAQIAKYNYGRLLLETTGYAKADSVFRELEKTNPTNPNFPYYLGLVKEAQNDSLAIEDYTRAFTIDSNYVNAAYKLAKDLVKKRQFNKASMLIEKGLSLNAKSIRFLNLKALSFFYTENYHESVTTYQQLIDLRVSNVQLHENLGESFSKTMRFEKAIEQYTVLINKYSDKNPTWHYRLANAYMALRYLDKAKRHLEIALVLKRPSVEAEYNSLALIYGREKDYKSQMEALKKVIRENPKNQQAHYFLATTADNYFKDKKVVLTYYEKYLKQFGTNARFSELVKQRIKDLKVGLHFSED